MTILTGEVYTGNISSIPIITTTKDYITLHKTHRLFSYTGTLSPTVLDGKGSKYSKPFYTFSQNERPTSIILVYLSLP